MNYTPEDYLEVYNDRVRKVNARHGWRFVGALLLVVVLGIWLSGCDGEAAQVTAYAEQDAYENYLNAQAAARYRPTLQPIKASTVEVTLTVCQQYEEVNRKWICYGVSQ